MNQKYYDCWVYDQAKAFLLRTVDSNTIEKYLHLPTLNGRPESIAGIYLGLLESAQNANMKAGVIGGSIGGVERLSIVLSGFEPSEVLTHYGSNWEQLLDEIVRQLQPRGQIRRMPQSIWPQYCRSILSSAAFLAQFSSADDFYQWADFFDQDSRARIALPLLLASEIQGIGFPLACDFLKELGYLNFGKPDVHIKDIFVSIGLSQFGDDISLFKAIVRVAENVGVSAYNVDKLFWLIGSGRFYEDPDIGRIGSQKAEFIAHVDHVRNKALVADA